MRWAIRVAGERDAALNAERVWERAMMKVCGEDGPASVASEIRSLRALRDTAIQALKSQVEQLAAENVGLRPLIAENWNMRDLLRHLMAGRPGGVYFNKWEKLIAEVLNATPATDRIVAEAEARGVDKAIAHLEKKFSNIGVQIMNLQWLANSLREGAE
ncbi:hypothetical protein ACRS85_03830 [Pluralibacter gergoviae]|uniref:hypothetical protein n=1 Tax=Pluralibacter gergoviae TaxID=61647 RepID=UPI003EDFFD47